MAVMKFVVAFVYTFYETSVNDEKKSRKYSGMFAGLDDQLSTIFAGVID